MCCRTMRTSERSMSARATAKQRRSGSVLVPKPPVVSKINDMNKRFRSTQHLAEPVRVGDRGAEEPRLDVGFDAEQRRVAIGRVEEIGEAERMEDGGELAVGEGEGDAISGCEGVKGVSVWLKMPLELLELLKMYVLKVRHVWSISIAAGIIWMLILGRRLYKMKGKNRGIPLKISLNDKKASQLVVRAGRSSESFSAVRRVPFCQITPSCWYCEFMACRRLVSNTRLMKCH